MLRLAALVTAVAAGAPTAVLATTAQAQAGAGSPSPVQYVLMQNEKSNQMQPNQIPFAVPHARPTPVSYAGQTAGRPGATSLAQTGDRATAVSFSLQSHGWL